MDRFTSKGDTGMRGGWLNLDTADLRYLRDKVWASVNRDPPPEDPKKTFTLEVRPEEVKVLYARVLALQSLVDGRLDPRELEYLYMFMSRIGLSSDSRGEVRQALETRVGVRRTTEIERFIGAFNQSGSLTTRLSIDPNEVTSLDAADAVVACVTLASAIHAFDLDAPCSNRCPSTTAEEWQVREKEGLIVRARP